MQTLGLKIQGRRASNSASFEALEALFSSASFEALEALFSIFKIERVYHFFLGAASRRFSAGAGT